MKNTPKEETVQTIAVVDEDVTLREHIVEILSSSSCKVLQFDSSINLLSSSKLKSFGCLILSIEPTLMETKKLIKVIKRENARISIIAIGNQHDVSHAVTCIQAGADDYIYKPINSGKIRKLVRRLLSR